ncbi:MAG: 2-oxo acid dehydrogenase subunit E2 [Chitinophagales bacterium]|nr:2-oxo acid dehydrogenase subunit E2 [Chitinophagaceae bacterium]MCB9064711.1 2-oxo acid dehydrogenase subunit E2 [Chitinophagales bacterium]
MAEAIRMPLLSDTMKEGIIAEWHKKVGDKVKSDDVLAEVETDKATMEVVPYVAGTLLYIGVEKGSAAKVNDIIAIIGKEGEDYKSLLNESPAASNGAAKAETTEEKPKKKSAPKSGDATVIRMPLLSDTMKEGKIVAWNKSVGDKVKSDDVLAEVETDKATMEVVGYVAGTLLYIGVEAGNAAKVNEIIAIVGKEGTDIEPYLQDEDVEEATEAKQAAAPQAASTISSSSSATDDGDRIKASPLAKSMAKEKGIDLRAVHGTGPGGRIIKEDIENYTPSQASATTSTVSYAAPVGEEGYTESNVSQMRGAIARRLGESKFTAPHFYLRMTITMDKAIEARKAINDVSPVKVSFNDLVIKACAMALRQHPQVNSSWLGDKIRTYQHIHVGSAVAIDDGLIVPVIKFADSKSLSQIAEESKVLADKARNKKLQPPEFSGNTFTVSNLGMMDIDEFTAIINPPDSCILAVGKIAATPVVENGQVVVRQLMKITLSCDHRVVDGAVGSRFLQTLKAHLENPVTMLV